MPRSLGSLPVLSPLLSRRGALQIGSLSLFGLSLDALLTSRDRLLASDPERGKAKSCILLFMWGGPAHQDTWDLKPDAPAEIRGEFAPISTNVPGIQICEHFPLLSRRADKLCLLRTLTHNNADHTPSTHFLLTGQAPPASKERRAQWPHMGAVLSRLGRGRGALPAYVSMRPRVDGDVPRFVEESQGQFGGWLGAAHDPLTIDHDPNRSDYRVAEFELQPGLSAERLEERLALRAGLNNATKGRTESTTVLESNLARARDLLTSAVDQRRAFDLSREPQHVRERYGLNPHGQSVLQARRLVEAGVPLVTVFWPNDGTKNVSVYWDTHSRNFIDLKQRLMPPADQAFSALLDDLEARDMLDETLVIWTGEFGRTPRVGQRNSDAGAGRDGRDHWPGCFTSVLAGGGVQGGAIYGKSDKHAAYPATDPIAPADLIATVYHLLGVGEHRTITDPTGRPVFVRQGRVLSSILS